MAGGLATLNPCAFPLRPAFLSLYVGADQQQLPRPSNRIAQGLLVGLLVAGGFLGVFAGVGLPVAYGVTLVADAVPWMGMAVGLVLLTLGGLGLAGRRIGVAVANPLRPDHDRRLRTHGERVAGRWLAEHGFGNGPITWDEYFLFAPDGRWEQRLPDAVGSGGPVIGVIQDLEAQLAELWQQA